jgi:ketosteroid isomerase-like protein
MPHHGIATELKLSNEQRDEKGVLDANRAFYRIIREGDFDAMDRLWAQGADVACTHPGWPPLHGRDEVMESWARVFDATDGEGGFNINCDDEAVYFLNDGAALVVCSESLDEGLLAATNCFRFEEGGWRLMHHHAGPLAVTVAGEDDEAPPVLH